MASKYKNFVGKNRDLLMNVRPDGSQQPAQPTQTVQQPQLSAYDNRVLMMLRAQREAAERNVANTTQQRQPWQSDMQAGNQREATFNAMHPNSSNNMAALKFRGMRAVADGTGRADMRTTEGKNSIFDATRQYAPDEVAKAHLFDPRYRLTNQAYNERMAAYLQQPAQYAAARAYATGDPNALAYGQMAHEYDRGAGLFDEQGRIKAPNDGSPRTAPQLRLSKPGEENINRWMAQGYTREQAERLAAADTETGESVAGTAATLKQLNLGDLMNGQNTHEFDNGYLTRVRDWAEGERQKWEGVQEGYTDADARYNRLLTEMETILDLASDGKATPEQKQKLHTMLGRPGDYTDEEIDKIVHDYYYDQYGYLYDDLEANFNAENAQIIENGKYADKYRTMYSGLAGVIDEQLGRNERTGRAEDVINGIWARHDDEVWDSLYTQMHDPMRRGNPNLPETAFRYLNDRELYAYNYLVKLGKTDEATALLEDMQPTINLRRRKAMLAGAEQNLQKAGNIGSFLTARGANLEASVWGWEKQLEIFGAEAMKALGMNPKAVDMDPNQKAFDANAVQTYIDSALQQRATDWGRQNASWMNIGENDNLVGWGYQAMSSSFDSLLRMGMGPAFGVFMFTGGAMDSDLARSAQLGIDPTTAGVHAAIAGAIEQFTEEYSIEKILGDKSGFLQHMAKGFVAEGSEEMFADVLNAIGDWIGGGMSEEYAFMGDYQQTWQNYVLQGYSPQEAEQMALTDFVYGCLQSGAIGGMSGLGTAFTQGTGQSKSMVQTTLSAYQGTKKSTATNLQAQASASLQNAAQSQAQTSTMQNAQEGVDAARQALMEQRQDGTGAVATEQQAEATQEEPLPWDAPATEQTNASATQTQANNEVAAAQESANKAQAQANSEAAIAQESARVERMSRAEMKQKNLLKAQQELQAEIERLQSSAQNKETTEKIGRAQKQLNNVNAQLQAMQQPGYESVTPHGDQRMQQYEAAQQTQQAEQQPAAEQPAPQQPGYESVTPHGDQRMQQYEAAQAQQQAQTEQAQQEQNPQQPGYESVTPHGDQRMQQYEAAEAQQAQETKAQQPSTEEMREAEREEAREATVQQAAQTEEAAQPAENAAEATERKQRRKRFQNDVAGVQAMMKIAESMKGSKTQQVAEAILNKRGKSLENITLRDTYRVYKTMFGEIGEYNMNQVQEALRPAVLRNLEFVAEQNGWNVSDREAAHLTDAIIKRWSGEPMSWSERRAMIRNHGDMIELMTWSERAVQETAQEAEERAQAYERLVAGEFGNEAAQTDGEAIRAAHDELQHRVPQWDPAQLMNREAVITEDGEETAADLLEVSRVELNETEGADGQRRTTAEIYWKVQTANGEQEVSQDNIRAKGNFLAVLNAFLTHQDSETLTPGYANMLASQYQGEDGISAYLAGMNLAFRYGYANLSEKSMRTQLAKLAMDGVMLTSEQERAAYEFGRRQAENDRLEAMKQQPTANATDGTLTLADNVDVSALDGEQKAAIDVLSELAKALKITINITNDGSTNADGDYTGANGSYLNGVVTIDLNANKQNAADAMVRGGMLVTAAHELTHHLSRQNAAAYENYRKAVYQTIEAMGLEETADDLIRKKLARLRADNPGRRITHRMAEDEVIADLSSRMLESPRALREAMETSEATGNRIRNALRKVGAKLTEAFAGLTGSRTDWATADAEAATLRDRLSQNGREYANGLQKMWEEMASQAAETRQNLGEAAPLADSVRDRNGDVVAAITEDGSIVANSLRSFTDEEKKKILRKAENQIKAGRVDYTMEDVQHWLTQLEMQAKMIAANPNMDYQPMNTKRNQPVRSNQEYIRTVDFSTLCAKRRLYQGTYNAIAHRIAQNSGMNIALQPEDVVDLRVAMANAGWESPCAVCYVESRRKNIGKFAEYWLHGYYNSKDEWVAPYQGDRNGFIPRIDQVVTTDGLQQLREEHPQAAEDFEKAMDKFGSANPKIVQMRAEYTGELKKLIQRTIKNLKAIGGLRVQSFSDFELVHLMDMLQVVTDMSLAGVTSQAYTKVPAFGWIFGGTGIKINLSLLPMGTGMKKGGRVVTRKRADGSTYKVHTGLEFSAIEGIDPEEAFRIREHYSRNVGTILVAVSYEHLQAAMQDDRIDMIIPYHKSGWAEAEMIRMTGAEYNDFTETQNEKLIENPKAKIKNLSPVAQSQFDWGRIENDAQRMAKAKEYAAIADNKTHGYWDFSVDGVENAKRYLAICDALGRSPKFYELLHQNEDGSYSLKADGSTDGYWKLLTDFKMYDHLTGEGTAQQNVKPVYDATAQAYMQKAVKNYTEDADRLPASQAAVDNYMQIYNEKHGTQYSTRANIAQRDDFLAQASSRSRNVRTEALARFLDAVTSDADYTNKKVKDTWQRYKALRQGMEQARGELANAQAESFAANEEVNRLVQARENAVRMQAELKLAEAALRRAAEEASTARTIKEEANENLKRLDEMGASKERLMLARERSERADEEYSAATEELVTAQKKRNDANENIRSLQKEGVNEEKMRLAREAKDRAESAYRRAVAADKTATQSYVDLVRSKEFASVMRAAENKMNLGTQLTEEQTQRAIERAERMIRMGADATDAVNDAMHRLQTLVEETASTAKTAARGLFVQDELVKVYSDFIQKEDAPHWSRDRVRREMLDVISAYYANLHGGIMDEATAVATLKSDLYDLAERMVKSSSGTISEEEMIAYGGAVGRQIIPGMHELLQGNKGEVVLIRKEDLGNIRGLGDVKRVSDLNRGQNIIRFVDRETAKAKGITGMGADVWVQENVPDYHIEESERYDAFATIERVLQSEQAWQQASAEYYQRNPYAEEAVNKVSLDLVSCVRDMLRGGAETDVSKVRENVHRALAGMSDRQGAIEALLKETVRLTAKKVAQTEGAATEITALINDSNVKARYAHRAELLAAAREEMKTLSVYQAESENREMYRLMLENDRYNRAIMRSAKSIKSKVLKNEVLERFKVGAA